MNSATDRIRHLPYLFVLALLLLLNHSALCANRPPAPGQSATGTEEHAKKTVVVSVGEEELTEEMLQAQLQTQMRELAQRNLPPQQFEALVPQIRKNIEDRFITMTLLKQEAARQNIEISREDVDEVIVQIKTQLPQGMTLEDALEQQDTTEPELRELIGDDLCIRKLLDQALATDIEVNDDEVAAFYEEHKAQMSVPESVHARHILLMVDKNADRKAKTAQKAKAEKLQQELVKGADFAKLAAQNSDCPSKTSGGDLGTFGHGQMVPPFEKAAFTQKINEIGPVVETQFGYHIIQVLEHNQAKTKELAEVKDEIAAQLKQQKQSDGFERYVAGLREKTNITRPGADQPVAQ